MCPEQDQGHPWKIFLIGGSSGVGKTVVARQLAHSLSISLLWVDDVRLALQELTSRETHPELHVFLNYDAEQWRNTEAIFADWMIVGGHAETTPGDYLPLPNGSRCRLDHS